ncbi:T9SS type A sorting domain-containing protein [Chryseobacterium sp. 18068]|uniref:T9SS type A sorting domain-containing protein n=2 Tax=Pseudomonadati TaxID=3379134 RepID=UPI001358321D|nr:T9SS type A sorting domain-containing protein [Chryseobacterium sp. 18068]
MNLKLQTKAKTIYAFLMALFSVWGWGQGTETFTHSSNSSSYVTISWTGTNGSTWTANDSRGDQVITSGNKAICVRQTAGKITGNLTTAQQNAGVGVISFTAKNTASTADNAKATTYQFKSGTVTKTLTVPAMGTSAVVVTSPAMNVTNAATIEITITGEAGVRVTIDDLSWTGYSTSTVAPTVTASSFTGTVGSAFSHQVVATETPNSYAVAAGSTLPLGLTLNTTTGEITGTPTAAGSFTTNITATNSIGTSSPATITFDIAKSAQSVTLNNLNANIGAANVTLPSVTNSGLSISYVSSDPAVASISGNTLTYGNIGTATITASNAGDANYLAFNETFTATVNFNTAVVPVANAATAISSNGFTANWNVVNGADSYRLDVYQTSGSVTPNVSVVGWTFEDQDSIADIGIAANNTSVISTNANGLSYANMTNNPISDGYVATTSGGWNSGNNTKYWKINLVTTGITNLKISSVQRSSNTGPRDFKVQYSLDDSTWTDVLGSTVNVGNDWSTGSLNNLSLPTNCENKSVVYLRWIMTSNTSANNGTVAGGGTSAIDNITIIGDQGTLTNNYILQNQNVGNVTSYSVASLTPSTVYHYVVRGVNGSASTGNSNEVNVTTTAASLSTTWNGTSWSNGTPASTVDAIFTGTYSTSSQPAFDAKNIIIQNGGVLEITSGNTISAVNVTVEDGGNLIQKDGSTLSYSGAFKALKNGTSEINKYAFWTSPVAGQNLANIYTGATPTSITEYDTATDYYVNAASTTSVFAKAYSIKTPVVNAALVFEGAPNSGTQTFALATSGNGFNLIGNPYPSSLSLGAFYTANSARISSTFYFWDNKSTNVTLQNGATTTNYGYATFNAANGANPTWVPAPNGLGGTAVVPTGSVANIGQGFIVKTLNTSVDTSLTFNNEMRGITNGTFFNKNNSSTEGKFWLRLNSEYNTNNTFAVDYTNGASDSFDNYDSKALGMGSDAFYTLADTQKLIIQGKESFDINDVVPVGAKHFQNGNFTIALVQKEGLFNNGQAIYLHDKITGIYTDLQNGAYTFTANSGESTDRFEIVYKLNVLATAEVQKDTFEVYRDGQDFVVRNNKNIEKVEIFDVAGRKIQTINESSKVIRVQLASKGVYILKASSEGKEYTKKIIK